MIMLAAIYESSDVDFVGIFLYHVFVYRPTYTHGSNK